MSKLKKVIKGYFKGRDRIFKAFNHHGWEEIDNQTKVRWGKRYDSIGFLDKEDVEYGYEYAEQIGKAVDGIVLYYVQENGDKYYVLLSVDNKMTDEYTEENFDW
jgi:hypothetical protein